MQKWNILTDIAQRVDEKNGIICLVIMLTPRIIVIKMSKKFVFSADDSKESVSLGEILKCIWKISFDSFRKCYGLLDSELPLARYQPVKTQDFSVFFCWRISFFDIFTLDISWVVTPKPINYTIFWKNSVRSFRWA